MSAAAKLRAVRALFADVETDLDRSLDPAALELGVVIAVLIGQLADRLEDGGELEEVAVA